MNLRADAKKPPFASVRTESAPFIAQDGGTQVKLNWLAGTALLGYEYLVFYFGYLYFGVGCALTSLLSAALHPLLPRVLGARLGRWLTGLHFRAFLALLQASGLVKIDLGALNALRGQHSIIIAPNHPSLLDAVLIISRLPQIACIMKADIWDNFFLGGGARLSGYIRNDSAVSLVRLSTQELRAGHQLLVFPEGTRTREPPINAFKGGFALMAKKSCAEIQTIFIETQSEFLNKDWPPLKKPSFPLIYRARLGKRARVDGDVRSFVGNLEHYYRLELNASAAPCACETRLPAKPPAA
jgi:1-acyl-sn-glycerol-3-phosphate acyltransferase